MRLTGKNKVGRYGFITENNTLGIFDENSLADKCYTKLGQLEDIEEDFNCDLTIFLQALKHGVFYKNFRDNKIRHTNNLKMSCFDGKTFCLENKWHYFLMSDYGKNKYNQWALTKEELL